jgi:peptidoglycan hydrolase-like protein with peptidoglycan-binding domain
MSFRNRLATTLAATAMFGAALTAAAGTANAATGASYISQGQNGFQVYCVQVGINWANWSSAYITNVDGSFGPNTLSQVKQLQKDSGLSQDGVVGRDTGDKLWQALQISMQAPNGNWNTPYGVPIGNCYQVLPTHS